MDHVERDNHPSWACTHFVSYHWLLLTSLESSADLVCAGGSSHGEGQSDSVAVSIDAVINSLRNQEIPFRGPFCTQRKGILFLVEGCILLESELVELFAQNKLNRDGIQELAKRIEAHSQ
jgi:hypothetical protein